MQEIEDELDTTTDLDKRNQLYKDYMHAYQEDTRESQQRKIEDAPMVIEAEATGTGSASSSASEPAVAGAGGTKRVSNMTLAEFEANVRQITAEYDKAQNVKIQIGRIVEQGGEMWAWDDVSDMKLPMELVDEAKKEEMAHMKKKTFKVINKKESYEVTGKGPISIKWILTSATVKERCW